MVPHGMWLCMHKRLFKSIRFDQDSKIGADDDLHSYYSLKN